MPVRDDILAPISGPSPSGVDLRADDDKLLRSIREARREDLAGTRDEDNPAKAADWPRVLKLSNDTLATVSKDLEVAVLLCEALVEREGLAGLKSGLDVVSGLLENFWDSLYPSVVADDEDPLFLRAGRLGRLGERNENLGIRNLRVKVYRGPLHERFQRIPLSKSGHGLLKYSEAREVGSEQECSNDPKRKAERQEKIEAGKMSLEEFQRDVDVTEKVFYKSLLGQLAMCDDSLARLRTVTTSRFGKHAPTYTAIADELGELREIAEGILEKKLLVDPDPVEPPTDDTPGKAAAENGTSEQVADPRTADEAAQRIAKLAEFLRKVQPTNPGPFLMLRGLRWGELRANGPALDPRLLVAPPTHVRSMLKRLSLDERWKDLLEQSENVMARPDGRGWLDLQRHVVTACVELGSEYERVAAAIRSELSLLLRDIPTLVNSTLMDDTPTANDETKRWLVEQGVLLVEGLTGAELPAAGPVQPRAQRVAGDPVFEAAQEAVRAQQPEHAIEILMAEAQRERSPRGRFLRMTQVAGVMVSSDFRSLALPILNELKSMIDDMRLDAWESGEIVAQPLGLLYQCLAEDADDRHALFDRLCKLDPVRALNLR